jgi:PAS domain S-box-containing protein
MELDLKTLVLIQSMIFVAQVIILFVQYKIGRASRGIGWWLLGSVCMSAGVLFMLTVSVKPLIILALISHPIVILGYIFFYVGVMRFLGRKENRYLLGSIYVIFNLSYFYFLGFNNNLSARTSIVCSVIALISMMVAAETLFKTNHLYSASARFTGAVFLINGSFFAIRAVYTMVMPEAFTYSDLGLMMTAAFILPTITSTLWTFGFIVMLNQKLNVVLLESEERYRSILNASPDDITITDLEGRIEMVSPASKKMFGYEEDYEGFVGMHLVDFIIPEDAERARANLTKMYLGQQTSNEYRGIRNGNSIFSIEVNSGFIRNSNGQPTKMVFIIRDITERKTAEQEIQLLVRQLEDERNTAQMNSLTDSLTGLSNRRHFDEELEKSFYRLNGSVLYYL